MVTMSAVNRTGNSVNHQPMCECRIADSLIEAPFRVKWSLRFAVSDEFQRKEQPAAPDIADMRVIGKPRLKLSAKLRPTLTDIGQQAAIANRALDSQRRCGGDGMANKGMAVHEAARTLGEGVEYLT